MTDRDGRVVQGNDQGMLRPFGHLEPLLQPSQLSTAELPAASATPMATEQQNSHPFQHQLCQGGGAAAAQDSVQKHVVVVIPWHQSDRTADACAQGRPHLEIPGPGFVLAQVAGDRKKVWLWPAATAKAWVKRSGGCLSRTVASVAAMGYELFNWRIRIRVHDGLPAADPSASVFELGP